jgi:hypothetical protein
MALTWLEHSEVVFGLILSNKLSLTAVRPEQFHVPYNDGVKLLKDGIAKEDIVKEIGIDAYQTAVHAVEAVNGASNLKWAEMLEKSSIYYDAGARLEKFSKKLQRGEDIDWSQITYIANKAQTNISSGLVPMNEVEGKEVPFIPTGWRVFDEHIGGFPEVGLVIIGGNPGAGKTYSMTKFAAGFVKEHTNKRVALFELEQESCEIRDRINKTENLSAEELSRIVITDEPLGLEQILSKCAVIENLGVILIDYVDYLVRGETTEPVMSGIYRTAVLGSKQLHCPIVLYAQLTGYEEGIPKPRHIRWTRLAHGLTWMLCMVYNPSTDEHNFSSNEDEHLPATPNTAYMIVWKVKGGFRKHLEDSPGAIAIPFRGDKGWSSTKGKWFSLKKS